MNRPKLTRPVQPFVVVERDSRSPLDKIPYKERNRWWPPMFRSFVRSLAPKNSTFIVNDILFYAPSGNGFRFPEKTCEWTEWQGRRPWRCNVQMCVKSKTSSARENAFRPASSINDSSFPTGILNNLPPPSSLPKPSSSIHSLRSDSISQPISSRG